MPNRLNPGRHHVCFETDWRQWSRAPGWETCCSLVDALLQRRGWGLPGGVLSAWLRDCDRQLDVCRWR